MLKTIKTLFGGDSKGPDLVFTRCRGGGPLALGHLPGAFFSGGSQLRTKVKTGVDLVSIVYL